MLPQPFNYFNLYLLIFTFSIKWKLRQVCLQHNIVKTNIFLIRGGPGVYGRCGGMGHPISKDFRILEQIYSYFVGIFVKDIFMCYHQWKLLVSFTYAHKITFVCNFKIISLWKKSKNLNLIIKSKIYHQFKKNVYV